MKSRNVTSVAIIYQAGAYGEGLATVFQDNFKPNKADSTPFSSDNERIQAITDAGNSSATEVLFIRTRRLELIGLRGRSAVDRHRSPSRLAAHRTLSHGVVQSRTVDAPRWTS